jgi:hypothetical protein
VAAADFNASKLIKVPAAMPATLFMVSQTLELTLRVGPGVSQGVSVVQHLAGPANAGSNNVDVAATDPDASTPRLPGSSSAGIGNPFAAFLGNPFGLRLPMWKHSGSYRAPGSWPSLDAAEQV